MGLLALQGRSTGTLSRHLRFKNKLLISILSNLQILLLSVFPILLRFSGQKPKSHRDSIISYPKSDPIAYFDDSFFRIYLESHPPFLGQESLVQAATFSRQFAATSLGTLPFPSCTSTWSSHSRRVILEQSKAPFHGGGG